MDQTHYVKVTTGEFLVYLGSCIGIWFGFSFFTMGSLAFIYCKTKLTNALCGKKYRLT